MIWYLNAKLDLNLYIQGLSEPEFYGDLVYKLKKIVGSNNFSAPFIKIISHYKKTGYNIKVLQLTACLVVKVSKGAKIRDRCNQVPSTTLTRLATFLSSLIARPWIGL